MVLSGLLVLLIAVVGTGLTLWIDIPLRLEERVPIGIVVGVVAVAATSFVAFELIGMGWPMLLIGVAGPGAGATAAWRRHPGVLSADLRRARRRLRLPWRRPSSLRPLALLTVLSAAVSTRILALAYQSGADGISAGNLAVWGDWSAHLAYSGSFAFGDNRSLELPLASGAPLRYHFLANFFASTFTVTGLELTQALVWSSWLVAIAIPPLLFALARHLTRSRLSASLVVLLFTLSGGWGAWYLVDDVRTGGWRVLTSLPRTYARLPDQGIWMDNTISASLYAQRSTQLGLACGLAAVVVLLVSRPRWTRSGFVTAGLLVGATGLIHVHTLLTALALGTVALLADRRGTWLWFLGPAAAVGLPLTYTLLPPTSYLRWLPGWLAGESGDPWPWFWLRNAGLLLPLFLAVTLLGGVPRRIVRLTAPLWLWFMAANLIAFHPWAGNNTKFFLFWQLAACIAIAELLRRAWVRQPSGRTPARWGGAALATVAFASLVVAGGIDTVRAMQRSTAIPWVDHDEVAAARWLRTRARPGDTLVYAASNTSATAALSGVAAVSGYPGWTFDLGLPDWAERVDASRAIVSGAPDADRQVERYGVDFVVIGPRERAEMGASDAYWSEHGALVFEHGQYRIFSMIDRVMVE